jgi:crotonobetainyl-CoA:carnitine CoA-transferase CaiB-like acyl-CoA transferase
MEVQSATDGLIKQLGFAYKMSETPPRINTGSPELGEQTNELLAELGFSLEEGERLIREGAVGG